MGFKANNYKFSQDILDLSAGNFKEFVKSRYKSLKASEVSELIDKYYGDDSGIQKKSATASQ